MGIAFQALLVGQGSSNAKVMSLILRDMLIKCILWILWKCLSNRMHECKCRQTVHRDLRESDVSFHSSQKTQTDISFFHSLSPPPPINPSFYYLHLAQSSQTALRLYSLTRLCCFIHEQTEIQRIQIEKECECFSAKWSVIELLCNRYDDVCASTWWKTGRIFHHIDILKILTH